MIITDITTAVSVLIKMHRVNDWWKLFAGLFMSGLCTFMSACGVALVTAAKAGYSASLCWVFGAGVGLPTAAGIMAFLFIKSPLTKGIMFVLPSADAAEALAADVKVFEKK